MRRIAYPSLLLSLALVACQAQDTPDEAAGDETAADASPAEAAEEIRALDAEWVAMLEEGNVDGIVDLYTENGRVMPPGSESAVGAEELRTFWSDVVEMPSVAFGPDTIIVSEAGDMAYDIGWVEMEAPGPDDELQSVAGKYLVVWENRDGEWKVAADMFNMNASGP